jgi:hypothetical protein
MGRGEIDGKQMNDGQGQQTGRGGLSADRTKERHVLFLISRTWIIMHWMMSGKSGDTGKGSVDAGMKREERTELGEG